MFPIYFYDIANPPTVSLAGSQLMKWSNLSTRIMDGILKELPNYTQGDYIPSSVANKITFQQKKMMLDPEIVYNYLDNPTHQNYMNIPESQSDFWGLQIPTRDLWMGDDYKSIKEYGELYSNIRIWDTTNDDSERIANLIQIVISFGYKEVRLASHSIPFINTLRDSLEQAGIAVDKYIPNTKSITVHDQLTFNRGDAFVLAEDIYLIGGIRYSGKSKKGDIKISTDYIRPSDRSCTIENNIFNECGRFIIQGTSLHEAATLSQSMVVINTSYYYKLKIVRYSALSSISWLLEDCLTNGAVISTRNLYLPTPHINIDTSNIGTLLLEEDEKYGPLYLWRKDISNLDISPNVGILAVDNDGDAIKYVPNIFLPCKITIALATDMPRIPYYE